MAITLAIYASADFHGSRGIAIGLILVRRGLFGN